MIIPDKKKIIFMLKDLEAQNSMVVIIVIICNKSI